MGILQPVNKSFDFTASGNIVDSSIVIPIQTIGVYAPDSMAYHLDQSSIKVTYSLDPQLYISNGVLYSKYSANYDIHQTYDLSNWGLNPINFDSSSASGLPVPGSLLGSGISSGSSPNSGVIYLTVNSHVIKPPPEGMTPGTTFLGTYTINGHIDITQNYTPNQELLQKLASLRDQLKDLQSQDDVLKERISENLSSIHGDELSAALELVPQIASAVVDIASFGEAGAVRQGLNAVQNLVSVLSASAGAASADSVAGQVNLAWSTANTAIDTIYNLVLKTTPSEFLGLSKLLSDISSISATSLKYYSAYTNDLSVYNGNKLSEDDINSQINQTQDKIYQITSQLSLGGYPDVSSNSGGSGSSTSASNLNVNEPIDLNGGYKNAQSISGSGNIGSSDPAVLKLSLIDRPDTPNKFYGSITGSISLIISGSGTQELSGLSTYTGGTFLTGGTVVASNPQAFGTGTVHTIDPTIQFAAPGTYGNRISLDVAAPGSGATQTTANDPTIFQVASGVTATLSGNIGAGSGINLEGNAIDPHQPLVVTGIGTGATLVLSGSNTYAGGTTLKGGITLDLTSATVLSSSGNIVSGAAGVGSIVFTEGSQTLKIEPTAVGSDSNHTFANVISGFLSGDTIDLAGIGTATSVNYDAVAHALTISGGSQVETLHIDAAPFGYHYSLAADGHGGTNLTVSADSTSSAGSSGGSGSAGGLLPTAGGGTGTGGSGVPSTGGTPLPSLSTLAHDATSPGGEAYALYHGLLGRAPDTAGLQALTTALTNGTSLHDATQALLTSPEGQSHFGGLDNAGFVAQLYQEVLNRPADNAGLAAATAALDHGLSRADLANNFVFSPEHLGQLQSAFTAGIAVPDPHAVAVAQAYYSVLGRAPDASGLQAYAGASLHDVAQGLMHSSEYASLTGMTSDTAYVESLYQHLLGRPADSAGAQTWTATLANGGDRAGVANALLDSAEFQSHYAGQNSAAYVETLYEHVLGRTGDTAGVRTWANALDHGVSRTDVAHAFTASSEFQAQAGGQSDAAFVEGVYTHALGRTADAAGEQAWLSALSHGASRADVVTALLQSTEAQAHLTAQIAHDWHLV